MTEVFNLTLKFENKHTIEDVIYGTDNLQLMLDHISTAPIVETEINGSLFPSIPTYKEVCEVLKLE